MLRDATLRADVCIVGGGPAGLALAETLRRCGTSVVLLESGDRTPGSAARDLNEGDVSDAYGDLRDVRARAVGGTAFLWNTMLRGVPMAKFVALDPWDFRPRPWVPHSGWPFGRETLDPFYEKAHEMCGLDPFREGPLPRGGADRLLDFVPGGLTTGLFHFGPAARFTRDLPRSLSKSGSVRVVPGTTVTSFATGSTGTRVHEARWARRDGTSGVAAASAFVVAAGGIETPRILLLAAPETALVDSGGWLGAGFMEHPVDSSLELVTSEPALSPPNGPYSWRGIPSDRRVMCRIALSGELVEREGLVNASIRLVESDPPCDTSASPMGRIVNAIRSRLLFPGATGARGGAPSSARGRPEATRYRVLVDLEQMPSRQNRVTLSRRRDRFGCPRAHLEWRWTSHDEENRRRILETVARELERAGIGEVRRVPDPSLDPRAHHHAGTTRMHADPSSGVVSPDLLVHEMRNLYVVGSSVFPTAGFANPTLTAVALAIRLGEHLGDHV